MDRAVEAYKGITATEEFQYLAEIRRVMSGHDEAQAISNAERRVRKLADEHWQGVVANVVAEKDNALAEKENALAEQAALIAELQARLNSNES